MSLLTVIKSIFGFGSKTLKLSEGDRKLECEDCKADFIFDAGEQRFFKAKGFTDPKRCPVCRKKVKSQIRKKFRRNRGGGGGGGNGGGSSNGHRHNNHHHSKRQHSLIDGSSPYADER